MRSLWDISPSVSTRAPVFPGDTPFQVLWNERINDGGVANISTIHMSPHVGAHVDAPMHLDSGAVDVATLRLERFIGRCRVIDLSGADTTEPVSREELSSACFHERVLIKTRRAAPERWTEDFRSVSPGAVRMLLESGVMRRMCFRCRQGLSMMLRSSSMNTEPPRALASGCMGSATRLPMLLLPRGSSS